MKDPRRRTVQGDEWGDLWVKGDRVVQVVDVRDKPRPLQTNTRIRENEATCEYTHDELVAEGWQRDKSLLALSDSELRALLDRGRHAETVLGRRHVERAMAVEHRITVLVDGRDGARPFTADELTYSAAARCVCGAGFAYPKDCGMHGAWFCSALLRADHGRLERRANAAGKEMLFTASGAEHELALPFSAYSIKSEGQPSACGATTRPA